MKVKGLSSKVKKGLRHNAKTVIFATNHVSHLASKERQKSLLMQAEQAQINRQLKEKQLLAVVAAKSSDSEE